MLQEFRVDNYKSLINVVFEPREVNLLVGLNNAGKTNLCQAMRFVSASSVVPLDQCADVIAGSRTGIGNFFFKKRTTDFHVSAVLPYEGEEFSFDYHLAVSPATQEGGISLQLDSEQLIVTGPKFDAITLLENTPPGRVRLLHEKDFLRGKRNYVETEAPRDATMLNRLYDLDTNRLANLFKRYLGSWGYYDLSLPALRSPNHKPNEAFLSPDGDNLSSVLYRLKTSNERDYRKLIEFVRKIDPKIDLINFQGPFENKVFMYFVDAEDHSLPAWNASAGTLRFLALAYVLLVQPPPNLLMIEEPENGIYVGFLKSLLEMIPQASERSQVIFTSHSPYFIDLFDEHLDSIFVLKGGEQHSTLVRPDAEKVKARLEQFPLGEQHFREMLG